jgi:hypothetical protein
MTKNCQATNKSESSAKQHRGCGAGSLPTRVNTVTAGFLAALLEGKELTGMEAVFRQSTTRAAAWVHYLENHYGWVIERRAIADGTSDGRVAWVTLYWLSGDVRNAAIAAGAREWIERVRETANSRRAKAREAKARAAHINAEISAREQGAA